MTEKIIQKEFSIKYSGVFCGDCEALFLEDYCYCSLYGDTLDINNEHGEDYDKAYRCDECRYMNDDAIKLPMLKNDIYICCPVRKLTDEDKKSIDAYVETLRDKGHLVYVPYINTDQNDTTGYRICGANMNAIRNADEIHIWFDSTSTGTLFDLGGAFALGKKIVLINEVLPTNGKSFSNMIIEWAKNE